MQTDLDYALLDLQRQKNELLEKYQEITNQTMIL